MKKTPMGIPFSPKNAAGNCLAIILGVLIPVLSFQPVFGAEQHNIIVMGGWTNPVNSANLASGAGSNLVTTYQSEAGATTLSIVGGKKDAVWQVYINRSEMNWPSSFVLYVRRTGPGDGKEGVTVRGGLSFQVVNSARILLCSGTGDVRYIPIQYQLSGVSLATDPNHYVSGVVYTVIP